LAISIIAIFFDVLLSSMDFLKFTVQSQQDFEKLAEELEWRELT